MVSPPCHGSGDRVIHLFTSYARDSTDAGKVSQATQVKSEVPDKKDTLVFQVKAWALGWQSYPIKNKPTEKKKIKIEFTTRQMLRIQASNGQGLLGMEEDGIQSQGPQLTIVPLEEEQVECKSYPCAVRDRLQGHTKDLDNETTSAKKQKHAVSLKR